MGDVLKVQRDMRLILIFLSLSCALVSPAWTEIPCGTTFRSHEDLFREVSKQASLEASGSSLVELAAYSSMEFVRFSENSPSELLLVLRPDLFDPKSGMSRMRGMHGNGPYYFIKSQGGQLVVVGEGQGSRYVVEWRDGKFTIKLWWHESASEHAPGTLHWNGSCLVSETSVTH